MTDKLTDEQIANETALDGLVTHSQLDAVDTVNGKCLSYSYDASDGISQLSGQGSGDSGEIQYRDTFKVTTPGTFLGVIVDVGDFVIALVANADVSDSTASNTDWFLDVRRTHSYRFNSTYLPHRRPLLLGMLSLFASICEKICKIAKNR